MENYEVLTKIGSGACGAVYLVRSNINGRQYALKKVQLDEQKRTRTREALLGEARILSKLKHPHIVVYHDSFFAGSDDLHYIHIVQDYCDGGTLEDKVIQMKKKQQFFEEATIMEWFIQIAMAVQYIHSHKILHRDLKSQNVFMTKSDGVKLGDFGIAKALDSTLDAAVTCVGTPCYLSPELCQDIPYSSKADIWALGCLLFELCALKPAFDACNLISLFYKITKGEYSALPEHYSAEMKELIAGILVKEPDKRPSASAILNMATVRNYLETFIQDREYLLQQKIITLRSKATSNSGGCSPGVPHKTYSGRSDGLLSTVRRSTPVMHTKLLSSLPELRKSFPPRPSGSTPRGDHHLNNAAKANACAQSEPEVKQSLVSPNYSDDFDSTPSSRSLSPVNDEEEEIPEELSDIVEEIELASDDQGASSEKTAAAGQAAAGQAAAEQADEAQDPPSNYDDDEFEEDSEAEELDEIISKAKEAHTLPSVDDYFVDENHMLMPKKQSLRQYLDILGDYDDGD